MNAEKLLAELRARIAEYKAAIVAVEAIIKSEGVSVPNKKLPKRRRGVGSYKGKHWTQQPKNRERLRAMIAKSVLKRKTETANDAVPESNTNDESQKL